MLSINQCKKLLGEKAVGNSDEEIKAIRDNMYSLAYILVEQLSKNKSKNQNEKRKESKSL